MTTTSAGSKKPGGARVAVQRFGSFLSNMILPNIAAFIAWGIVTMFFIPAGFTPNESLAELVGPMITYLLPLLIANQGGRLIYDTRGGVVATIATMGVIVGTDIPMFLGAMIMGPLAAWLMKQVDRIWEGKIKAGFEMLVNNFSAGILGFILAIAGFFAFGPVVQALSNALEAAVDWLVALSLLPLLSILVEPGKVLFLNNAINHGVFTPIGTQQASETGKSILFLVEANPGPGLGILLAFTFFGIGMARATAPAAIIIQFFGGIHEIYFPYVLMKPLLIVAAIAGGMTGVATNVVFNSGLRAPAAPGSIIAVLAQTASDSFVGVILSVILSAAVSFFVAAIILRASRKRDLAKEGAGDLSAAIAQTEANKGKESGVLHDLQAGGVAGGAGLVGEGEEAAFERKPIHTIIFACDAGMGSSAMGATVLRNKIKKAGIDSVDVTNKAIANLTDDVDLVVTHQDLTDRAKRQSPNALHVSVDNFMNSPKYDEIVFLLQSEGVR
ncbi:PTS mannitol transporter subunit IICB [Agromyces laixinhei]|uniref:PTS mannitol transporter subunit IICB n=1 Tax=Agromyces laixinhei TaxID=2585717 RepID=UPI001116F11A|nr:PTS mannitol transporter subunit IICB [Agromyces laixinhei]